MMHHEKTPRHVDEQESPEPERLVTPEEAAGMELEELERPPQAEGARDLAESDGNGSDADSRGDGRGGERDAG